MSSMTETTKKMNNLRRQQRAMVCWINVWLSACTDKLLYPHPTF
jgi:hypothetical protein